MTDTAPLTDQQLDAIRAYFERTTHPDWRDDTHIGQLLAEVDRLRAELARYVGKEPTLREETAELARRLDAVDAVCDAAERQATRWEHPLPVPEWVATVRAATNGETPAVSAPTT